MNTSGFLVCVEGGRARPHLARASTAMLAPKAETEGRAKAQWYGEASWASLKGRVPSDAWDGDPKRNEDALAVDARSSLFGLYDGTCTHAHMIYRK